MPSNPTRTDAGDDLAGRPCPYCHTPIDSGEALAICGDCGAAHHAECWDENTGCAITGCAAAPDPGAIPGTDEAATAAHAGRIAITLDGDASDPDVRLTAQRRPPVGLPAARRPRWPIAVAAVLALGMIGGLIAVLSGGQEPTVNTTPLASARATTNGTQVRNPALGACATQPNAQAAPVASGAANAATRAQLAAVTRQYLAAIAQGDDRGGFRCLSPTAQTAFAPTGNTTRRVQRWASFQRTLAEGLPTTPNVKVSQTKWLAGRDGPNGAVRFFADASAGWTGKGAAPRGWLWAQLTAMPGSDGSARSWTLEPALPPCSPAAIERLRPKTVTRAGPSFYGRVRCSP